MIISGFMHKIHYKNRYLHVETEYFGSQDKKQIVTMIYEGGSVLDKICSPPETEEADACRKQMAGQHKQALRNILAGRYDLIAGRKTPATTPSQAEPAADEVPLATAEVDGSPVASEAADAAAPHKEGDTEAEEQEDTRPVGDAVNRARYKLRELSSLPGFIGLNIFTSENRSLSLHGNASVEGQKNTRDFDDFLKKARDLTLQAGMGEAQLLHLRGDRLGILAMFFAAQGDERLQPIAETFSHMVLFMQPQSAWMEAEGLMNDLMKIIRSELVRFSLHLTEAGDGKI